MNSLFVQGCLLSLSVRALIDSSSACLHTNKGDIAQWRIHLFVEDNDVVTSPSVVVSEMFGGVR